MNLKREHFIKCLLELLCISVQTQQRVFKLFVLGSNVLIEQGCVCLRNQIRREEAVYKLGLNVRGRCLCSG